MASRLREIMGQDKSQSEHGESLAINFLDEGAIPSTSIFRGKPDDDYDVESYLYVEGELIRVKGPNDKMP